MRSLKSQMVAEGLPLQVEHNGCTYRVGRDSAYVVKSCRGAFYLSKITSPRKLKLLFKLAKPAEKTDADL